jgi:hypothetical protein
VKIAHGGSVSPEEVVDGRWGREARVVICGGTGGGEGVDEEVNDLS